MSLLDLQAALNVDSVYVDEKVAALVKREPARYILLQGELMTACVALACRAHGLRPYIS